MGMEGGGGEGEGEGGKAGIFDEVQEMVMYS